jgi:hypothetical protein
MRVWMLWHGGASYAVGDVETDLEEFGSLRAAADAFAGRASPAETYYPCVSEEEPGDGGPEAWVYLTDPRPPAGGLVGDAYPDRIVAFGPRGGVRIFDA